jgi:hypothetical protein
MAVGRKLAGDLIVYLPPLLVPGLLGAASLAVLGA